MTRNEYGERLAEMGSEVSRYRVKIEDTMRAIVFARYILYFSLMTLIYILVTMHPGSVVLGWVIFGNVLLLLGSSVLGSIYSVVVRLAFVRLFEDYFNDLLNKYSTTQADSPTMAFEWSLRIDDLEIIYARFLMCRDIGRVGDYMLGMSVIKSQIKRDLEF